MKFLLLKEVTGALVRQASKQTEGVGVLEVIAHDECPFYPCSFLGQSCRHCFCCLYPCRIEGTGGKYIETKTGHKIWDCSECKYVHQQHVVELLSIDPNETDERKIREAKEKLKSYIRGE